MEVRIGHAHKAIASVLGVLEELTGTVYQEKES